jgi:multidrug efflux pump subunit AcrB
MHWLRRYRVGLVLLGLLVAGGVLELRRHGLGLREAVVRAGRTRLHRIVMRASPRSSASFPWRSAST